MSVEHVGAVVFEGMSTVGATTDGAPFRLGAQAHDIQVVAAPGALVAWQGAEEAGGPFAALSDADGAAITNVGTGWKVVRERPEWGRVQIAADASGPRLFKVLMSVAKDVG